MLGSGFLLVRTHTFGVKDKSVFRGKPWKFQHGPLSKTRLFFAVLTKRKLLTNKKNMLLRSLVILDECHGAKGKSPMAELLRLLKLACIVCCFLKVILVIFSKGQEFIESCLCVPRRKEERVVHFHFFFRVVIGEVGLMIKVSSTFKQPMSGRDRLWRSVPGSWDWQQVSYPDRWSVL